MHKRHYVQILLLTLLITLLVQIFFGSYIAARLATLPFVRKWGLLRPDAPIVINRRETVRVSDSGDIRDAVDGVTSKLSTIVVRSDGKVAVVGTAINLSSDGVFLTGKSTITGVDPDQYTIVLQDGRTAPVQQIIPDPAVNIVLLKAAIDRVPVANVVDSKGVSAADRALFVYNDISDAKPNFYANFITVPQRAGLGQLFNADRPGRTFGVMPMGSLIPGEAIINLGGNIIGMWSGSEIVSSDVMKEGYDRYFASKGSIMRPAFGFSYKIVGKTEAAVAGSTVGAEVVLVTPGSAAQVAGLQIGDVIAKVNDISLGENGMLEEILEKFKPSEKVSLAVLRNKQSVMLTLTAGSL